MSDERVSTDALIPYAAQIVSAYLEFNKVVVADIPELIRNVRTALEPAPEPFAAPNLGLKPKQLVSADYLRCGICGFKGKMLKRHLMTAHGMTPDAYRKHLGLPADHPMVAASYSEVRSGLAIESGLGRNTDNPRRVGHPKKVAA